MQIDTAFIPAGGKGTRLRPLTYETPKPLIEVSGKPIIVHMIEWLKKYGIKNIVMGLYYMPEKIQNYLGDGSKFGVNIKYILEKEEMSDAGSLKLAEKYLPERFLHCGGDLLTDLPLDKFIEKHKNITVPNKGLATAALYKVDNKEEAKQYGIAKISGDLITEFIEKPENPPTNLANCNIYILEKKVLDLIPQNKFCHLAREIIIPLVSKGKVYQFSFSGYWIDIGSFEKLERARQEFTS